MADERSSSRPRKHKKKKESLEVLCRLTPYAGHDPAIRLYNETTVITSPPAGLLQRSGSPYPEALYNFGYVFDESESQQDVFDRSTLDMIEQVIRGKNGLLFTYGVTGSGKTYTMTGKETSKACGILPRAMDVLFNSLPCQTDRCVFYPDGRNGFEVRSEEDAAISRERIEELETEWNIRISGSKKVSGFNDGMVSAVFVSYVEIYNNLCYDLFDETLTDDRMNKSRDLRVNGSAVYVDNLTEIEVTSTEQVMELYVRAQERRKVAETILNKTSSRSHSIFNVRVVMAPCRSDCFHPVDDPNRMVIGQLSLVDLAGSERTKRTGNNGDRLVEAGKINQSLMALRQCFEKIRERDRNNVMAPIPYRDSKITHLFKNFFEGSGKIRMIVCVNPRPGDFEENLSYGSPTVLREDQVGEVEILSSEGKCSQFW
uniref:Kinesin-like protein n=1 Tax=Steinernema glaseri TaxID=37863 RepID=A0A1I7YS42_9BILA